MLSQEEQAILTSYASQKHSRERQIGGLDLIQSDLLSHRLADQNHAIDTLLNPMVDRIRSVSNAKFTLLDLLWSTIGAIVLLNVIICGSVLFTPQTNLGSYENVIRK